MADDFPPGSAIVSDLPRHAFTRTARLARLPAGFAGRTALGTGKRLGGRPAELVNLEIQERTAAQVFRVLGELKGGAMKLGQALSIFEAALPPEIAEPYRATLTRLQESAPPLPAGTIHKVLAGDMGEQWRTSFAEFEDQPAAAASIGQEAFAAAYADDPDVCVPRVVSVSDHILVSEWLDGTPLATIIADGTTAQRNRAGIIIIRFLFSGPMRVRLLHADPHPGNFRLLADGRLGVLDFGAVDRLPDGFPPIFGTVLRLMHEGGDLAKLEDELRSHGYLRDGVSIDPTALHAFLTPLAEPSRAESFRFSREWLRTETIQASALRSSSVLRRLNLPPSYLPIHRVLASGLGVLCQLECEVPFRAEVVRLMPGYARTAKPAPSATANGHTRSAPSATANGHTRSAPSATANGHTASAPPARPEEQARSMPLAGAEPRNKSAQQARSARPARPEQITLSYVQWRDIMAKLPRPQAPARFRVMFPDLADWLESPWTGPPPFPTGQVFRLEETIRDECHVIRAELPGLDPENDIEVTVDGRILTIRAERRQQDDGPYRSEFRYGSLTRSIKLPARVDAADVTARYAKGVLEISIPVGAVKPEGTRIPIVNADAMPEQPPDQAG
jgi:HSP20 family molecular chaperone IbpA